MQFVKFLFIFLLVFLLVVGIVFLLGPKPDYPTYDGKISPLNLSLQELDNSIIAENKKFPQVSSANQAELVWFDGQQKTEYSFVYLHGFSASPMEGDPVHRELAKRYGANLYLARLARHGIQDPEEFANLTPKEMIDSAKEAIAIGKLIGEKVILLATSTGGTLGTYLAAENPDLVHSMVFYSPNFALYDSKSKAATWPWGKQMLTQIVGKYRTPPFEENAKPYWTHHYRIEGVLALVHLVNETMTDQIFKKIDIPYFIGYWYKNEEVMDKVISIKRINEFNDLTATPTNKKRLVPFSEVDAHVLCSPLMSKDVEGVKQATFSFLEEVLGLTPLP